MQPPRQHSRINVSELKAQIVRRLGPERSKQYFYYLSRLLSLKVSKVEFEKLCVQVVGRENIPLHNQFIRSILKNACSAKVPPPTTENEGVKTPPEVGEKDISNGCHTSVAHVSKSPVLSNGDILPVSPRKARSHLRDRRSGDRRSALRLNGNENPGQHQSEKESEVAVEKSPDGPVFVHRRPLEAPFGVPFCPVNVGGACRVLSMPTSSKCVSASSFGGLLDSEMMKERMEQISVTQGLEGVSTECANLLNSGLDAYLKRIIGSCIGLVGSRLGREPLKNTTKLINGVRIDNHFQIPRSGRPSDVMHEHKPSFPITLHDFTATMEQNPQQLGEDWPLLLEKICIRSFDV